MESTIELSSELTFEKVWAMFQESDRRMQETERLIRETEKQMKETDKKISKLGSRLGELIEELVLPNITEKFNKLDYTFTKAAQNTKYKSQKGQVIAEVDVLLENGDYVMVVEVKTKPAIDDVRGHIRRMEILRQYADEHGDKRKYLGTLAGGIVEDNVREFAQKSGFFVLEQTGETVRLSANPPSWQPKEW
jgi:hypothetical protein